MENNSPDFYQIADVAELKKMLEEHTGIILYFYNDDCQPCISLRPKVETMIAERYPQMKLIYINSKAQVRNSGGSANMSAFLSYRTQSTAITG